MTGSPYEDIIGLVRPVSKKHPPMPMEKRAIQFAPFAALSGYGDCIDEAARLTEDDTGAGEDTKAVLDRRLRLLNEHMAETPFVSLIVFRPDARKSGGAYVRLSGEARKMDLYARTLTLSGGQTVPIDSVRALDGALFQEED